MSALVLTLTLSACSGEDEPTADPPLDLDESSAAPSESASPSPSVDPEEIRTDFASDGLVVTKLPDVTGAEREAVEAYIAYERGIRRMGQQAKLNSLITDNTTPDLVAPSRQTAEFLSKNDSRFRGTVEVELSDLQSRGRLVGFSMCLDAGTLELVSDGSTEPLDGPDRSLYQVVVTQTDGWTVTERSPRDEPC